MPQSEAACLLQSGSMYQRRLGLRLASGEVVFSGVKPGAVSIYFGDAPIYHFDLDGRWQRAFVDGTHYLKGLDATVRSVDRERASGAMVLRRGTLPYALASDLDVSIRSVALSLIDDLDSGRLEILATPGNSRAFVPDDFRNFLDRVIGWDSAAWFAHRERYLAAYGPLPFLPPDAPTALMLQATLGHVDGNAFGGARVAEHYIRSPAEFLDHAQAVAALTGRRIAQHRGIFLGGADVLHRPVSEVLGYLRTMRDVFPIGDDRPMIGDGWDDFPAKLGSVHAFLDDFTPPLPDLDGWRALHHADLGRITLGVESGDPDIRASFGKDWRNEALSATVDVLKAASIGVGIIVLIGAGDSKLAGQHVEATASLVGSLPLGKGDLVSLVDVRLLEETAGKDALSVEDSAAQVIAIKARLTGRLANGPKIVVYNPLKRWA